MFFRTVPSANTLVRWVNENAFASIVQARPCPTFGRPVPLRGSPHRLQPGTSPHALRIPPRDGHPALRGLRSGGSRAALVCFRLSPSCPFRPLHTFRFSGQRGYSPRLWIRRSSFDRRRDFNPPEQRAAQRTSSPSVAERSEGHVPVTKNGSAFYGRVTSFETIKLCPSAGPCGRDPRSILLQRIGRFP